MCAFAVNIDKRVLVLKKNRFEEYVALDIPSNPELNLRIDDTQVRVTFSATEFDKRLGTRLDWLAEEMIRYLLLDPTGGSAAQQLVGLATAGPSQDRKSDIVINAYFFV